MIMSSCGETSSALRPKPYSFAPETGLGQPHQHITLALTQSVPSSVIRLKYLRKPKPRETLDTQTSVSGAPQAASSPKSQEMHLRLQQRTDCPGRHTDTALHQTDIKHLYLPSHGQQTPKSSKQSKTFLTTRLLLTSSQPAPHPAPVTL